MNDSANRIVSAANIPAVLRAVEDNERSHPTAENIGLWLCNSGLMQIAITSKGRSASPSAEPTSADLLPSVSVIKW